jgi:hypothetical protein
VCGSTLFYYDTWWRGVVCFLPHRFIPGKGSSFSLCRRKSGWPKGRMKAEENEKSVPLPGIETRFHGIRPIVYPVYGENMPVS